jgi:hypothetical protein
MDTIAQPTIGEPSMKRLRPLSWVIIVINILFAWSLFGGVGSAVNESCKGMTGDELTACQAGTAIGAGIGGFMIMTLWVMVDIILLVIFLVTKKKARECPGCGRKVKVGLTQCASCGHNFIKQ